MVTYAAYYNHDIRMQSSSGGVFFLFAELFDVVYGVAMSDDCYEAEFRRFEGDFTPAMGSKYIQAKLGNTFSSVLNDLREGKTVLFSGTGCQVNGLLKFLGKPYDNLFCIDVVCHGVPSPKLWQAYVRNREQDHKKIERVDFRCKNMNQKNIGNKKDELYIKKDKDPYMRMFLRDFCLRPSCYICTAKTNKLSDITLGDFWGIEKVAPALNDGYGTSLVIVRTEKGRNIFERIREKLVCQEVDYEESVQYNTCEYRPVLRPAERDTFFCDLDHLSWQELEHKYAYDSPQSNIVLSVARRAKKHLNNFILNRRSIISSLPLRSNEDYGMLLTWGKRQEKDYANTGDSRSI